MLNQIDLNKELGKSEYKTNMEKLTAKFALQQRQLKEHNIPVIIVVEGWGMSGKAKIINQLIHPLDPRGFNVFALEKLTEEERAHSFFWPFWTNIASKGRIHIFDQSWYSRALEVKFENDGDSLSYLMDGIGHFEKQLVDDGSVVLKFFLHITKDEFEKRLKALEHDEDQSWKVTKQDKKQLKHYEEYLEDYDKLLVDTDTGFAPWHVIEAMDRKYAIAKMFHIVTTCLDSVLERAIVKRDKPVEDVKEEERLKEKEAPVFQPNILKGVDLSCDLSKEDYKKKVEKLQKRLMDLQNRMVLEKVPVIVALEGWDAAGKGGAIKRITEKIDPRYYEVIPISAPNDLERQYHYLWRFYKHFPRAGHLAIFDRTWYGRVLVERVEGFATEDVWKRAYNEINEMEQGLVKDGYVLFKFWLHIDKEEQEKRFKDREVTVEKQWKITEEDWRNRAKWDEYEVAVDEMLVRTSTALAPWVVVEANSKYYARVKILETIVEKLEKTMDKK